jgi:hypothetical protein
METALFLSIGGAACFRWKMDSNTPSKATLLTKAGERRRGVIERFDVFAAALQQTSLIGSGTEATVRRRENRAVLPRFPKAPPSRGYDEQVN